MKTIIDILKTKKLQYVFLFYTLLILPVLSPLAQNIDMVDSIIMVSVNVLLYILIVGLSLFCSPKNEKLLFTILLIASILPSTIYLGYLLFAQVLLGNDSVTSLFETNRHESKEFVINYMNKWISICILLYAIIPTIMIWKIKPTAYLKIKDYKVLFVSIILAIISVCFINRFTGSIYFINFYKTFVDYKTRLNDEEIEIAKRQIMPYEVSTTLNDSIPQTIVVIIGESHTRCHMSLYNYGRNTNPLLSKRKNDLYIYDDVISPQVHTIPVIRSVLTLADKDNPQYFTTKPSLFELFNRAGFDTYFISNQPFGGVFKTSYDDLLNLAKYKYNLSLDNQNDAVVLSKLDQIVNLGDKKNKLIIVHLIGSHMAYEFRYPKEFDIFDNNKDHFIKKTLFRDAKAIKAIDAYDNSVAFNDFVIDSIINILEIKKDESMSMIYFSDHGEEIYDCRNFAGHAYEKISPYMCQIPFVIWLSEKYKQENKDVIFKTDRPFSTCNFLFSLSQIAGLKYKDYESYKSLFSTDFKPEPRYIGNYEYNNILNKELH